MKVLVFGSLNIDKVYSLTHLPDKGETLYCNKYEKHVGGKGLNQAVSLSKAGMEVYMAGCIGADGKFLIDFLDKSGVNTDFVNITDGVTGHAVIEVDTAGQNQMILYPGANCSITEEYCDRVLENFGEGDLVLMQYETSCVEYMLRKAYEKGLKTALNPSPYTFEIKNLPFEYINFLILNEFEGQCLTGSKAVNSIVDGLCNMVSDGAVVLTLGSKGSIYADEFGMVESAAFKVDAVDTTGAGDTFTGYFLSSFVNDGLSPEDALRVSGAASALAVTKFGAAETIPFKSEVEEFLENQDFLEDEDF